MSVVHRLASGCADVDAGGVQCLAGFANGWSDVRNGVRLRKWVLPKLRRGAALQFTKCPVEGIDRLIADRQRNGQHRQVAFGRIVEGIEVLDAFEKEEVEGESPKRRLEIVDAVIEE